MKRCVALGLLAIGACAPTQQTRVVDEHRTEMREIGQFCADMASGEKKPHAAEVKCQFDAVGPLLRSRGFADLDLFHALYDKRLQIAEKLDSRKITEEQSEALITQAENDFQSQVQHRDGMRAHQYAAAWAAFASGMQSMANAYTAGANAYSSCPACQRRAQQGQADAEFSQREHEQAQQRQQMDQLQQKIQGQQQQIDDYNSWSPAHRLWGPSYVGP